MHRTTTQQPISLDCTMSVKQCYQNNEPGIQATSALAAYRALDGTRPAPGLVAGTSARFIVDQHQAPQEIFPRIEWSSNHDMAEMSNRKDHLHRLLRQRTWRRASCGLVRSKSMLCLPTAAKDFFHRHERTMGKAPSSTLLSAVAVANKKEIGTKVLPNTPLPPLRLSCLRRSDNGPRPSSIWNAQKCSRCHVYHQEVKVTSDLDDFRQDTTARSNEKLLFSSLLQDCPFPTCP